MFAKALVISVNSKTFFSSSIIKHLTHISVPNINLFQIQFFWNNVFLDLPHSFIQTWEQLIRHIAIQCKLKICYQLYQIKYQYFHSDPKQNVNICSVKDFHFFLKTHSCQGTESTDSLIANPGKPRELTKLMYYNKTCDTKEVFFNSKTFKLKPRVYLFQRVFNASKC